MAVRTELNRSMFVPFEDTKATARLARSVVKSNQVNSKKPGTNLTMVW